MLRVPKKCYNLLVLFNWEPYTYDYVIVVISLVNFSL